MKKLNYRDPTNKKVLVGQSGDTTIWDLEVWCCLVSVFRVDPINSSTKTYKALFYPILQKTPQNSFTLHEPETLTLS